MWNLVIKTLITSLIIVGVSEISKRSSFLSSLIISWPITSILVFFWIYFESKDVEKISQMSWDILFLIIPSLILFIALPILLKRGLGFYFSIGISLLITTGAYFVFIKLIRLLKIKNL